MSSRFGWVDFADEDRRKMLDVIGMFQEQDTRDELGLGPVRDAFADDFFPGTSTIQTRTRYMLFIPWIYTSLERQGVPSAEIAVKARRDEVRLIYALLKGVVEDSEGIIGREAKDRLQRLPSSVYWSGLGSWGIRLFPGSADQYHRHLDHWYKRREGPIRTDDKDPVTATTGENWDPSLPKAAKDLLKMTSLELTCEEADYLRDKIQQNHPESLLSVLLDQRRALDADFLWSSPVICQQGEPLRQIARHAQNFSESMHGVMLIYNLLLSRKSENEGLQESFGTRLDAWATILKGRWEELTAWHDDLQEFWLCRPLEGRTFGPLKTFVETWLRYVFALGPEKAAEDPRVHQLIVDREVRLKRGRARLLNQRALELWGGASGDRQLDYRWRTAKVIAADILAGLGAKEAGNA